MWATDRNFTDIISNDVEVEINAGDAPQYYYFKGENASGCSEMDSVLVGAAPVDASLPEISVACDANEGALLEVVNNDPEQQLQYLWSPEDRISSDPTMGPSATLNPGVGGVISVLLDNQYGCMAELFTTVEVEDIGGAAIEASETSIRAGNPVELSVVNCDGCSYQWEPADQVDNPSAGEVTVTPVETTTYTVTVTKGRCEEVLSVTIETFGEVCSVENVFIPRAFTPNGDGENDVFFVRSNIIQDISFKIFNRWGQEVFDSNDINIGWDGTFRGSDLPPDVYGLIVEATCVDGGTLRIQGNVTLLR